MLLGVIGVLVSGAGIVGCWSVLSSLSQRTSDALGRVETILDATSDSFEQVRASLEKADRELEAVREAERVPAATTPRSPQPGRAASRRLASKLTSSLGDAQHRLDVAVEAAVVVDSLLDGLDEVPLVRMSKLDTEQLQEVSARVASLTRNAQRLQAKLDTSSGSNEVDEETSQMRQILSRLTPGLQRVADRIDEAKGRVADLRSRIARWLLATQFGLTVVLLWIGMGQGCLLAQGWSWCRSTRS
jgi:hypothetical protein